jgi:hypothetical protein
LNFSQINSEKCRWFGLVWFFFSFSVAGLKESPERWSVAAVASPSASASSSSFFKSLSGPLRSAPSRSNATQPLTSLPVFSDSIHPSIFLAPKLINREQESKVWRRFRFACTSQRRCSYGSFQVSLATHPFFFNSQYNIYNVGSFPTTPFS